MSSNNDNKRTNSLPSIDGHNSKKPKCGGVQNQAVANVILPELLNSNENRCQTPPNQRITQLRVATNSKHVFVFLYQEHSLTQMCKDHSSVAGLRYSEAHYTSHSSSPLQS